MRGGRIVQSCAAAAVVSVVIRAVAHLSLNDLGILFLFLTVMSYFSIFGE
jgi:hypothetical protein